MQALLSYLRDNRVALFTRAWIEIFGALDELEKRLVALFTRAWIEIFGALDEL